MERKAKNRKIISGIMLILSCFTLMACKNAKLSLSSSTKSLEAATEESIIPSESYTEEESSDSTNCQIFWIDILQQNKRKNKAF